MNSVAERLLETWLDSQAERRYQPAFIQMLVSEGWRVLHNTRHSPIELGKDVIARDPKGVLHCFQLKGNPSSRVTKAEASALLGQFNELLTLPPGPEFRKGPRERHVAVFVTNGEIDEEARLLFERAGEACNLPSTAASSYELWSRGQLLTLLQPTMRIWPTTLEGMRLILNLLAGDGREPPVPEDISRIMASLRPPANAKSPARTSALTSMLVVSEIVKARWYEAANHQALHAVTVIASVAALSLADTQHRLRLVAGYATLALEHSADLLAEARDMHFEADRAWAEHDILGEYDVMWERRRLVADCAAVAILGRTTLNEELQAYAADLVDRQAHDFMLWGQAQVPSMIGCFWARSRTIKAVGTGELDLARLLQALQSANCPNGDDALPQPYYAWPDVWALRYGLQHATETSIFEDNSRGHLRFGRAIMFMLAKRNRKDCCVELWPDFTRLVHEEPELPSECFFSAVLSDDGSLRSIQLREGVWDELVAEAEAAGSAPFLDKFQALAWLIAAYVSLVPYRAWTNVLMWLDDQLNSRQMPEI